MLETSDRPEFRAGGGGEGRFDPRDGLEAGLEERRGLAERQAGQDGRLQAGGVGVAAGGVRLSASRRERTAALITDQNSE